jgi:hypothetical protein
MRSARRVPSSDISCRTTTSGVEVGDEVEVLVGSYVRFAVVERIIKGAV